MVPQPDMNNMNNDNSNTSQGDQIAAAFINAVAQAVLANPDFKKSLYDLKVSVSNGILANPDLNKGLISLSNSIEILRTSVSDSMGSVTRRLDALENAQDKGADREQDEDILQLLGEVSELRNQLNKVLGRVDEVEDTVSECDGLRHRVDDLESQVEDLDAVTTDQVEDIVADKIVDHLDHLGSHVAKAITLKGLSMIVAHTETEDGKI